MNRKTTPAITVIFYIIGILFLAIAAFMLVVAISYTRTYLQSYDASFADMWSNSIQYIIVQFAPYMGVGVICLGLGRVVSEMRKAPAASAEDKDADEETPAERSAASLEIAGKIKALEEELEANREVLSIKIEEKEKRDAVRMKELEGEILYALRTEMADRQTCSVQPEQPVQPAETVQPEIKLTEAERPESRRTQHLQQDETVHPEIHTAQYARSGEAVQPIETAEIPPVPQIFTIARSMTMPKCPARRPVPQIFTMDRRMVMPECPVRKPVPRIFTIAGSMTMPVCPRIKAVSKRTFSNEELESLLLRIGRK